MILTPSSKDNNSIIGCATFFASWYSVFLFSFRPCCAFFSPTNSSFFGGFIETWNLMTFYELSSKRIVQFMILVVVNHDQGSELVIKWWSMTMTPLVMHCLRYMLSFIIDRTYSFCLKLIIQIHMDALFHRRKPFILPYEVFEAQHDFFQKQFYGLSWWFCHANFAEPCYHASHYYYIIDYERA